MKSKTSQKTYIASALLFILLWSCVAPDGDVPDHHIKVDIDARHDVSVFDIFERVELIPLETTDESIFQRVGELDYHNGVLYILDWRTIFAFDATTGQFLFKIDDEGQGPQEYLHISNFEIDTERNIMLVLDPIARNLIEYDLTGKHLRRTKLPEIINAYWRLRYLGNNVIAFWTADNNNRLKFYDRSQNSILSEHLPIQGERNIFDAWSAGIFSNNNLLISHAALNNIYEVFPDGTYSLAYTWNFGRLNNSETIISNLPESWGRSQEELDLLDRRVRNSEIVNYYFTRIGGNQTHRYAQIMRRNQYVHLLHNVVREHTYVFTKFSEGATFFPIFWSDEFVIGLGPFADYREDTIPDAILDDRNLAIKRNICEFDNPVLIKYWFRR